MSWPFLCWRLHLVNTIADVTSINGDVDGRSYGTLFFRLDMYGVDCLKQRTYVSVCTIIHNLHNSIRHNNRTIFSKYSCLLVCGVCWPSWRLESGCQTRERDNCEWMATWVSLKPRSLSVAVLERFTVYVTLRCHLELWPRDLDLWHLTLNIRSVPDMPRSNPVPNLSAIVRAIRGGVIAVWIFDLMTFNMCRVLRYALG